MTDNYLFLFITGIVGGFIAGLSGIGTGFILIAIIPIALDHLGVSEFEIVKLTIANTIFATMCSAFMNNIASIKSGKFYPKESFWASVAAIISASAMLHFTVLQAHYSKEFHNVVVIIFLIYVVIRTILKLRTRFHPEESITKLKLVSTGILGGAVAAFTGLGGGSIIMPLLNVWLKIDIKKAKAITYSIIFAIAFTLTLINLFTEPAHSIKLAHYGLIIYPIAIPLAIGVIIASPIGVIVSHKVSSRLISYAFLTIIILVIIRKSMELFV